LATDGVADVVYVAAAEVACKTPLCAWFLGGEDVEVEDGLGRGILRSRKEEEEEEHRDMIPQT